MGGASLIAEAGGAVTLDRRLPLDDLMAPLAVDLRHLSAMRVICGCAGGGRREGAGHAAALASTGAYHPRRVSEDTAGAAWPGPVLPAAGPLPPALPPGRTAPRRAGHRRGTYTRDVHTSR